MPRFLCSPLGGVLLAAASIGVNQHLATARAVEVDPAGSCAYPCAQEAMEPSESIEIQVTDPQPWQVLAGPYVVRGWALDASAAGAARPGIGPEDLEVWLGPVEGGVLLGQAVYGRPRGNPHFDEAGFQNVGFEFQWDPCDAPPGPATLHVWASSTVIPGAYGVVARDVFVAPCPWPETISLVEPAPDATFDDLPRYVEYTWDPLDSNMEVHYTVQVEYFVRECPPDEPGTIYRVISGLEETQAESNFVGAQPGRWRVWALASDGTVVAGSEARCFYFLR